MRWVPVLCAPEEVERSRLIGEDHLREIGSFLIERYDVVIVDGSRALDGLLELPRAVGIDFRGADAGVSRGAQRPALLGALARAGYGLEAVKIVVNRYEKRGGPLYVSIDQLKQTLGAAPFWALPNRYEEAMKAIHEARPIVMKGNAELGRSYRDFGKKLGMKGKKPEDAPVAGSEVLRPSPGASRHPLPEGEGQHQDNPSPSGRGWREAPGEGRRTPLRRYRRNQVYMAFTPTSRAAASHSDLKSKVHRKLLQSLNSETFRLISKERLRGEIGQAVEKFLLQENIPMTLPERDRIIEEILDEVFGSVRSSRS